MLREIFRSKIHNATVTEAELYYEGSITVDRDLLDAADILPFEKVQVVNFNNGARLETYALEGKRGSGVICLNGPAAHPPAAPDHSVRARPASPNPRPVLAPGVWPRAWRWFDGLMRR